MRTGTRCTALVKFAGAFSGGSIENTAPEAGASDGTDPSKPWPPISSTAMWTFWPGSSAASCGFLEIGGDMQAVHRHDHGKLLAGTDEVALLHRTVASHAVIGRAHYGDAEVAPGLLPGKLQRRQRARRFGLQLGDMNARSACT